MFRTVINVAMAVMLLLIAAHSSTNAHCDTMDGPTVADGKLALSSGDITPALKWVMPAVEPELKAVFDHVVQVRKTSESAGNLADLYFLETLVRLHRAGEGAPYTGLKPAGTEVEPVIGMADQSLDRKSVDALVADVTAAVERGIRERFEQAVAAKEHKDHNVDAGRTFVATYVTYVHYVENIAKAAAQEAVHGESESAHQH